MIFDYHLDHGYEVYFLVDKWVQFSLLNHLIDYLHEACFMYFDSIGNLFYVSRY